jgi:hypothetical protein
MMILQQFIKSLKYHICYADSCSSLYYTFYLRRKDLESRRKTRKFVEGDAEERSDCARC